VSQKSVYGQNTAMWACGTFDTLHYPGKFMVVAPLSGTICAGFERWRMFLVMRQSVSLINVYII